MMPSSMESVGSVVHISYFVVSFYIRNHYRRFSRRYKRTIAANTKQFEHDNMMDKAKSTLSVLVVIQRKM
jgi:hypothetical protein